MAPAVGRSQGDGAAGLATPERRLLLSHTALATAVWCIAFTSQEVLVCRTTISTPV
jgi:hypothetical protein